MIFVLFVAGHRTLCCEGLGADATVLYDYITRTKLAGKPNDYFESFLDSRTDLTHENIPIHVGCVRDMSLRAPPPAPKDKRARKTPRE